jgi:hypothetical protein
VLAANFLSAFALANYKPRWFTIFTGWLRSTLAGNTTSPSWSLFTRPSTPLPPSDFHFCLYFIANFYQQIDSSYYLLSSYFSFFHFSAKNAFKKTLQKIAPVYLYSVLLSVDNLSVFLFAVFHFICLSPSSFPHLVSRITSRINFCLILASFL